MSEYFCVQLFGKHRMKQTWLDPKFVGKDFTNLNIYGLGLINDQVSNYSMIDLFLKTVRSVQVIPTPISCRRNDVHRLVYSTIICQM